MELEPSNPLVVLSVKNGLTARILHEKTPPCVLQHLVHFHNAFHDGARTSFCEAIAKTQNVEAEWAAHRIKTGLTVRGCKSSSAGSGSGYESQYAAFVRQNYPGQWRSFRSFEASKTAARSLQRLRIVDLFQNFCGEHVQYLDANLDHDGTVLALNAVIDFVSQYVADDDARAGMIVLEIFKYAVGALAAAMLVVASTQASTS